MSGLETQKIPAPSTNSNAFLRALLLTLDAFSQESTIIVLILTFFFIIQQRPRSKLEACGKRVASKPSQGCKPYKNTNQQATHAKSEEALLVQKLLASVVGKGFRDAPAVFKKYDWLVREQGIRLNQHISDFQQARSFYVALIATSLRCSKPAVHGSTQGELTNGTARLLNDMRSFEIPRNLEFYALVMRLHSQERLFKDVITLYDQMKLDHIEPDAGLYVCLMNAAVEIGDSKARHFFDKLCELGPPNLRTYMTMLRQYAQRKDWQGAVSMLANMTNVGSTPDSLVLNHVLALCVSVGQIREAESLLTKYADIVDVITCNTLMKGYAHQADLPKSEARLEQMLANGPSPNVITFNTIMDCAVRMIQIWHTEGRRRRRQEAGPKVVQSSSSPTSIRTLAQRPWQLLNQMVKLGIEPDRYTVSTLVKGMHMTGGSPEELDRAIRMVRTLGPAALTNTGSGMVNPRDHNTQLVEVIFNTLLDICCSSRDLDRMTEIFGMMQEFNVETSTVTFGTLIKAFGQAGQLQRCHEVWKKMLGLELVPTVVTYGCYIDACIRNEDVNVAELIFHQMIERRVRPNAVIYTSMIRGFTSAFQPVKAFRFYCRMREDRVEPTSVTFNSVLDTVARQLETPTILQEVLDDMSKAKSAPDVVTYTILINASCNAGNLDDALALFNRVQKTGARLDHVAFNTMLLAFSKADRLKEAEEIFAEMTKLKIMPTSVTTAILVKMYGRVQLPDKVADMRDFIDRE